MLDGLAAVCGVSSYFLLIVFLPCGRVGRIRVLKEREDSRAGKQRWIIGRGKIGSGSGSRAIGEEWMIFDSWKSVCIIVPLFQVCPPRAKLWAPVIIELNADLEWRVINLTKFSNRQKFLYFTYCSCVYVRVYRHYHRCHCVSWNFQEKGICAIFWNEIPYNTQVFRCCRWMYQCGFFVQCGIIHR